MPGSDLLLALAEIGVALAGLGSLVAVFLRRGADGNSLDMPRLWLVLEFSLGLCVFAVIPLPLAYFGFATESVFRVSGLLLALFLVGHMSTSVYMVLARPDLSPRFPRALASVLMSGHLLAAGLLVSAWFDSGVPSAGAYLVAVSWLLAAAIVNFVRLVWVMAPR